MEKAIAVMEANKKKKKKKRSQIDKNIRSRERDCESNKWSCSMCNINS